MPMSSPTTSQIAGVACSTLEALPDSRGTFAEIFRSEWTTEFDPVQWNWTSNHANVLRGFHCHVRHTDLLVVLEGSMQLGLKDLRPNSPTFGLAELLTLRAVADLVIIPPGVGHGFYFPERTTMLNAVSHTWSKDDELGCRWNDSELGIGWEHDQPLISERDRVAGPLAALQAEVRHALVGDESSH